MNVVTKDAAIEPLGDADEFPGRFRVILSAPTEDRDGDTLLPDEWKTPLPDHITFDIDHGMSVATTVGSGAPYLNTDGQVPEAPEGALIVDGTYSSLPRAQETRTLVNEKHIRKTSVAFMNVPSKTKDGRRMRELLNGAFVAVPSNREASILESKGVKSGARNSASDAAHIQAIHDHAAALGASHDSADAADDPDAKGLGRRIGRKSVIGSLEATQDRARDALNDAYGTDAYVWLRATLPDTLVFEISTYDSSDSETYQQGYTDDGSVITLTGARVAVDLAEIVKSDPDEDESTTADAAPADPAAAAKAAAGSDGASAEEVAELQIRAARLRMRASLTLNDTPQKGA